MRGARDHIPRTNDRRKRRRRPLVPLLLSLGLHGLLLIGLLRMAPRLVLPSSAPPVEVRLISLAPSAEGPPASAPAEQPVAQAASPARAAPPAQSPALPRNVPAPLQPSPTPQPAPSPPAAANASSAKPGASAPSSSGSPGGAAPSGPAGIPFFVGGVEGCQREDLMLMSPEQRQRCEARIAAARSPGWLKMPGCASGKLERMTDAERQACDRWLAHQYAAGSQNKVDRIPAEKRAYYEAVAAAQHDIHFYAPPVPQKARGALGMFESDGALIRREMGGHPPGAGCGLALPFGAKGKEQKPRDIGFNLGPIHCGITPPQGSGTEESTIPPP